MSQTPANGAYFGRTLGSPPGLPGGGITGMLPASGVGARISGSTPAGGHNTPPDFASLSLSGAACLVVVPSGAMVPRGGTGCVGAQSVLAETGGTVCAGGVTGVGGACARTALPATISTHKTGIAYFLRMRRQRPARADVPPGTLMLSGFAVADQGKMPHRRHRAALAQA